MRENILHKLTNSLWAAMALFVIALAVYVSLGRFLLANLGEFREPLLREINARAPFAIELDEIGDR